MNHAVTGKRDVWRLDPESQMRTCCLQLAFKDKEGCGTGEANSYFDWCEEKIAPLRSGRPCSRNILWWRREKSLETTSDDVRLYLSITLTM
jgi:hypothetical protein